MPPLGFSDLVCIRFSAGPNAALLTAPDQAIFIADTDYEVLRADEVHETLGTDAGAVTADLKKCTGTQAASAGTSVLGSTFNLKSTINTVQTRKRSVSGTSGLAAMGTRTLSAGNRLCIDFGGTMTAVTGVCITVWLRRKRKQTF